MNKTKLRFSVTITALLVAIQSYAFSISTKTEMKNGLRTRLCINKVCETFEGAISVLVQDFKQQPLLLTVKYLGGEERTYNWDERRFLDEEKQVDQ